MTSAQHEGDGMSDSDAVIEPAHGHRCDPPRYRPKGEWHSAPAPPGWVKPAGHAELTMPTEYRPGTVWLCTCGRGWIRRQGPHYGRNPNFGHTAGSWEPVRWWHRQVKKHIATRQAELNYRRAAAVVESFVLEAS